MFGLDLELVCETLLPIHALRHELILLSCQVTKTDKQVTTAFDPKANPLNIPIIQLSLYNNEDLEMHYELGAALTPLRAEGIVIFGAGMAVHNLQDYRRNRGSKEVLP